MRATAIVVASLGLACAGVSAQEREPSAALHLPHVRAEMREIRALIADTAERSATFRALLDRLEASDVIVYIRVRQFPSSRLDGRIGFLAGDTTGRYLVIELACPRSTDAQAATLAHELHHATEIADAPWVASPAALARHYRRIGNETEPSGGGQTFETAEAQQVAARVRRELSDSVTSRH
jgi:hypothetical protein